MKTRLMLSYYCHRCRPSAFNRQVCIILLLFMWSSLAAQTFRSHLDLGYEQYQAGRYEEARASLEESLKIRPYDTRALFQLGRVLTKLDGIEDAFAMLNLAVNHDSAGLIKYHHMERDSSISALWNDKLWPIFMGRLAEKVCGEDLALFLELMDIWKEDQGTRRLAIKAGRLYGWESERVKELNSHIDKQDSLNILRIRQIISENGYPGKMLVGQASHVAFFVIQHADLNTQTAYFPMLSQMAMNGELKRSSLAMMEDRILIGKGKAQKYGTQCRMIEGTQEAEFLPIMDVEQVDIRRAEVGLSTLAEYAKRVGVKMK